MKSKLIFLVLLLPAAAALRAAGNEPVVVPVYEEPRHRLVFEKENIRIFNTNIPAGDRSVFHHHENPTLYVMLNGARMRNQNMGEEWTEPDPNIAIPPGTFVFRDYRAEPQIHRVENIDQQSFQVIGIINSGSEKQDLSSLTREPELDNPWFRGYRFKLAAGESSENHRHKHPVFVFQVGNGRSYVIERGFPTAEKTVAGAWSIHDAAVEHQLQNVGSAEIELVEIEVK